MMPKHSQHSLIHLLTHQQMSRHKCVPQTVTDTEEITENILSVILVSYSREADEDFNKANKTRD